MAAPSDSVAIFAEGSVEEQILELAGYVTRGRPEEERNSFITPFQNALKPVEGRRPIEEDANRRRFILSKLTGGLTSIGDGSDREIEGFFNLLFAHILAVYAGEELKENLQSLVRIIADSTDRLSLRYRVLSNLFNVLPRTSPHRYLVYKSILSYAESTKGVAGLSINKAEVQKWLGEWDIPQSEKSSFLRSLWQIYEQQDQPANGFQYLLLYVESLPPKDSADAALEAIATVLRSPQNFDFDALLKVEAVRNVSSHPLFSLLQIFRTQGLAEFRAWEAQNGEVAKQFKLDHDQLDRKIRLVTLSGLAFKHVGQNLPYSKIAETIQIDETEVERWAIDVIRAGLVWGKLAQTTQSFHIVRATARSFDREEWQLLEKRLQAWKQSLAAVLEVVANAKQQA